MLAIAGGKGGSGKTTTALGVSCVLARRGLDPVLVDCDCDMPDIHHLLDIDRAGGVDLLASGTPIRRACQRSTTAPGVRCLTAGDRSNVDAALARLTDWHGPVVLDCPPGVGPDAVRPLRHAREALVVSTDQPASLTDAHRTVRTARELGTPVVGTILRETPAGHRPELAERRQLLASIPSVESPLDTPQIRQEWTRVVDRLSLQAP